MNVAMTGTRRGISYAQDRAFLRFLATAGEIWEFHHGDCIGADLAVSNLVYMFRSDAEIHAWPGYGRDIRCHTRANGPRSVTHPPMPYLTRDRKMVDLADLLVAFPHGPEEVRSGTWTTVRHARKTGTPAAVFWPDGRVTRDITPEP